MESPILLTHSHKESHLLNEDLYEESKFLNIKCFKWLHNHKRNKYDEMFDYETEKFILSEYNVKNSFTIVDNFQRISFQDGLEENYQFVKRIDSILEDKYSKDNVNIINRQFTSENMKVEKIDKNFVLKYNSHAYQVCKYYSDNDPRLELSIGRFIRVGKFILKVSVLKINNTLRFNRRAPEESGSANSKLNLTTNDAFTCSSNVSSNSSKEESSCRFCFKAEVKLEDPLISVCNCRGTMRYLHTSCLQTWIKNKCQVDYEYLNPNCFKITLKNFFCEICKKTFPLVISESNRNIFLLNILKTRNNFIILKSKLIDDEFSFENFKDETRQIKDEKLEYYFVQFDILSYKRNPSVLFGRDKKCDIVLNDVSVSRKHFMIYLDADTESVKIKDLNSKFGTLINMQQDLLLKDKETIQKGNTVYHYKSNSAMIYSAIKQTYACENLNLKLNLKGSNCSVLN
jgi:hypothetical protein